MPNNENRLSPDFFKRDALTVAPDLLGKYIMRQLTDGQIRQYIITEVEAYCGTADLACHASKGRTKRTEVMYHNGGLIYMYLIYGMYWMLNIVTGLENDPQAVLIRGLSNINGPGRISKILCLDKTFYGENLNLSQRIWIENGLVVKSTDILTSPRIGINYAEEWKDKPWRFILNNI